MRTPCHTRGFTAVEILVVLGILAIFASMSASTFMSIRNTQSLKVASQDVWLALRSARSVTLASENDTVYGVRIEITRAIRFQGSTYVAGASTNVVYDFSNGVTATTSLSGGTQNIVFTRLTGDAQATGTISLVEPHSGATSSVVVRQSGLIDIIQ